MSVVTRHSVSFGQMHISQQSTDILIAYGLGSCIALCLYDPQTKVGGMIHSLLPRNPKPDSEQNPLKYIDQGFPQFIHEVLAAGARKHRLIATLCGGASVLRTNANLGDILHIGQRNIEAAHEALESANIPIHNSDIGGNHGRTLTLHMDTGLISVKTLGKTLELYPGITSATPERRKRHA